MESAMKTIFTLLVLLGLNGVVFGQHLSFQEMKGLLDVANSEEKSTKYLAEYGFKNTGKDQTNEEDGIKYRIFDKNSGKHNYSVTILYYIKDNRYEVWARSKDKNLMKYFQGVAEGNGFKQFDHKKTDSGDTYTKFRNSEYELTLSKTKGLSGTSYLIMLGRN